MARTVEMMSSKLGAVPLVLHLPVGEWSSFSGVWIVMRISVSIGAGRKWFFVFDMYIVCLA